MIYLITIAFAVYVTLNEVRNKLQKEKFELLVQKLIKFNDDTIGVFEEFKEKIIGIREIQDLEFIQMKEGIVRLVDEVNNNSEVVEERLNSMKNTLHKFGRANDAYIKGNKTIELLKQLEEEDYDVDTILDKISKTGMGSLTKEELEFLNKNYK